MAKSAIISFKQALDHASITTAPSSVDNIMSYQVGYYRVAIGTEQTVFPLRYGILEIIKANAYGLARFTAVGTGTTESKVFERAWNIFSNTWYDSDWLRVSDEPVISDSNYCKLPDGTLLQWLTVSVNDIAANATVTNTVTFPVAFIDTSYKIIASPAFTSIPGRRNACGSSRTTTTATINFENNYSATWTAPLVDILAIGRWK